MNHPTHTNKTDSPQKQRMCVGNAETRCGRAVNGVLFTAVSKGAQRSGSDRLPPMLTKYQSGERSFRLYFLLVRFLCTSKENEQIKSFPNKFTFLRNLTNNQKDHPVLYWQHSDHLGSASWITDTNGTGIQRLLYMPFGEPLYDYRNTSYNSRYTFSGKERDVETGYSYFGARYYNSDLSIWLSVDPMADNTPSVTPYAYCINNPIKLIDPNGEDWYEVENTETKQTEIKWTDYKSQAAMDEAGVKGNYLGAVFMDVKGSRDEKLGKGNNLFGEDAQLANATVYGPSGKDDIKKYDAFTMSSDFSKYGAIADGIYTVNYRNPGKNGSLSSNWAVNDGKPVNCLDGKNPNPGGYSSTQKNGIYIHRSNNNGDMLPKGYPVSTGCIIIVPSRNSQNGWNEFNSQLSGVSSFKMRLKRD